jgi:DNA polymerase III epsilon subunit-like protein
MKRLVIDTETTGLSPRLNKTLTVGMLLIDVDQDFLEILNSNHLFIKHKNYNVDPEALKINKINLEEHNQIAVEPKIACRQINNFIGKNKLNKTIVLGHNVNFDRGFVRELFHQENLIPKLHTSQIDTMHLWNNLKKRGIVPGKMQSNLQTLADFFKIDRTKSHDALADCNITAKVYQNLLKII